MMNFGYNNRWIRLVKDILFVGICLWLLTRKGILAWVVGILGLAWYGRDAYYQGKALWQEKHYRRATPHTAPKTEPKTEPKDGKITVTDLSDAKEVNYEKEQA